MRGEPLHVEQALDDRGAEQLDECHQRRFRRIGTAMEHRLPREQPTDADSVQSPGQLAVAPRLDRVNPAESVQRAVRADHSTVDPSALSRRIGARSQHLVECRVHAYLEPLDRSGKRSRHSQIAQRQDRPTGWRPPQHRPVVDGHREDTAPIGSQHGTRLQVSTGSNKVLVPRVFRSERPWARWRFDGHWSKIAAFIPVLAAP
jgi:hypothetical protein